MRIEKRVEMGLLDLVMLDVVNSTKAIGIHVCMRLQHLFAGDGGGTRGAPSEAAGDAAEVVQALPCP